MTDREAAVTLVQWIPTGITLNFAEDGYGHANDIPDLEQQLREHVWHHCRVSPPILACNLGHPMYLTDRGGRLSPRHWRLEHDAINHGESDEHKACKERVERVMTDRGLSVHAESSLTSTGAINRSRRNDLLIVGTKSIGYEAQYSYIHPQTVARRHGLAAADGITTYFGAPGNSTAAKNIIGRAPYGTYNHLPAEYIRAGRPMYVTGGFMYLKRWRCAAEPLACPHFGKRAKCKQIFHSEYETALRFGQVEKASRFDSGERSLGIDQDEVLYGLATGIYVPVQLKRPGGKAWQIVPVSTIDDYLTDGGQLWSPPEPAEAPRGSYRAPSGLLMANPDCSRPPTQDPQTATARSLPEPPPPLTPEELGGVRLYRSGRPFGYLAIGWEPAASNERAATTGAAA